MADDDLIDDPMMAQAIDSLRRGGVVGMPTETVYGLAGDARDPEAVARIFAIKGRPRFDPLIVHVADIDQAQEVAELDDLAQSLAMAFWPGPLTLVLPRRAVIADLVTSGLDTVAVRCPDHPMARALIAHSGCPLAAPSANRFGRLSPTTAEAVREQLGAAVPIVLDGGGCRVGVESTVLQLQPRPCVLRPGGVTSEAIAAVLDRPVAEDDGRAHEAAIALPAPGMLASHYAPETPLRCHAPGDDWSLGPGECVLAFRALPSEAAGLVLSPAGDLLEAAARLFASLRALDARRPAAIVAELVPEEGIGRAINDRLRRAATRP